MIFPLWKSLHSLNLMLPKEDRKALLLRLFNDDTPLVNLSQRHTNGNAPKVEIKVESSIEQEDIDQRRNSSSEEDVETGGAAVEGTQSKETSGI
jgi:multisite-specific tRNA:(cytosine-C5)-methyltransferase